VDQVIWIEILSHGRNVAARLRFSGPEIRIGRGYDNDVVLDDPYVAARHLRICRDEAGRLVAEDAGSVNGLFLDRGTSRQERIVLDGERPIRIGHTYIRIREAGHAVPGERAARRATHFMPVALTAALGVLILGIEALSLWLGETGEPRASRYLVPLLGLAGGVAAWVAVWALLSRIFSGHARFGRNLLVALSGLFALTLYNEFAHFSAFALTWRIPAAYAYVAVWCIAAAVCFLHLREVGPSRLRLKGAVVVALLALAVGIQTLWQSEALYDSGQQTTVRHLMPPVLRLVPVRDEGNFFAAIEQLKSRLDRDRVDVLRDDAGR
jgi:hypothetical protein